MNFKLFLCGNCQKKEEEENFQFFDKKDSINNNDKNMKKKILLSSSDIDDAMNNNLEIIEYPYSNTCNNIIDKNKNYIPVPLPVPIPTNILNKKYLNDSDNYLEVLQPQELLNEGKGIKKEVFKYIENKKITGQKENKRRLNIENNNNNIKINSVNFSDYIYNENRFSYNKNIIVLNNNNSGLKDVYNNQKNEKTVKNNSKDSKDKIYKISNCKNTNGNINGLKVDYPCPDTDSFFIKSCNDEINSNGQNKEIPKNKVKKINIKHAKEGNNKISLKKIGKRESKNKNKKKYIKINNIDVNNKKNLIKKENKEKSIKNNSKSKITNNKNLDNIYENKKIRYYSNSQLIKKNPKKYNNNYNCATFNKNVSYEKTKYIRKRINNNESIKTNINFDNSSENELNNFKNDKSCNNKTSKIDKNKIIFRLSDKINFNIKNNFSTLRKKDNIKIRTFQLLKTNNKTNIFPSKTYMNPFSTIYCRKKKAILI
jgi:hypothetical protein